MYNDNNPPLKRLKAIKASGLPKGRFATENEIKADFKTGRAALLKSQALFNAAATRDLTSDEQKQVREFLQKIVDDIDQKPDAKPASKKSPKP